MTAANCRDCGREVVWALTPGRSRLAFERVERGFYALTWPAGKELPLVRRPHAGDVRYEPHDERCPFKRTEGGAR